MNTDILNEYKDLTNEIAIDLFGTDYGYLSNEESELVDTLSIMVKNKISDKLS